MPRTILIAALVALAAGCARPSAPREEVTLRELPVADLEGIIARDGVFLDTQFTSDGNGSLRVETDESAAIRLYELGDVDVENARLNYQAHLRTENVTGKVYLEMWCRFPGGGEFFSRALASPLTGTNEWTTQETPFFLQKGQNPDNVKLNLVVEGRGVVWIDDIRLTHAAL